MLKLAKMLLVMSLNASILVILIILIKAILGERLNVKFHYFIWFVLIIKLIIPYGPESNLSVFNLFNPIMEKKTAYNNYDLKTQIVPSSVSAVKSQKVVEIVDLDIDNNILSLNINYKNILMYTWLLGVIFCLARILYGLKKIQFIMKNSIGNRFSNFDSILNEYLLVMNIKKNVSLIYTNKIGSPCLYGFIKPVILMPINIANNISEDEFKYIIIHELCHLKRKDILVNWITIILSDLYWFNPIIRYGFYKMKQDCEVSCDAYALKYLDSNKNIDYGDVVVKILQLRNKNNQIISATSMAINTSEIKRRIIMISKNKKVSLKSIICGVVVIAAVAVTGLTNGISKVEASNTKLDENFMKDFMKDFMKPSKNYTFTDNDREERYIGSGEFKMKELEFKGYENQWSSNLQHNTFSSKFKVFDAKELFEVISSKEAYTMKIDSKIESGTVAIKIYNDKKVIFEKENPSDEIVTISKEDAAKLKIECVGKKADGNFEIQFN